MSESSGSERRVRRPRNRTGCITCRIRRVKCDEAKPHCNRCTQSGRVCDGYTALSSALPRRSLATTVRQLQVVGPASRVLAAATSARDATCFEFFRQRTAGSAGAAFPSEFWSRQLLQTAHVEPAVWRAAVALGALHRRSECIAQLDGVLPLRRQQQRQNRLLREGTAASRSSESESPDDGDETVPGGGREEANRMMRQAAEQYGLAMAMAREVRDPAVLLVLSLALSAICSMAGMWADGKVHVRSGLGLLEQLRYGSAGQGGAGQSSQGTGGGELQPDIKALERSLARLDLQSMSVADSRAPYEYGDGVARLRRNKHSGAMDDLSDASDALFDQVRRFMIVLNLVEELAISEADFHAYHAECSRDMERWERDFEALLERLRRQRREQEEEQGDAGPSSARNPTVEQRTILSLRVYQTTQCLTLRGAVPGPAPEMGWDAQLGLFRRLVDQATELARVIQSAERYPFSMSLEPGYIMPLFLVAMRCRHPIVRRRALQLMRRARRQEGVWVTAAAVKVIEVIILTEEKGMGYGLALDEASPVWIREAEDVRGTGPSATTWDGWVPVPWQQRILENRVVFDAERQTMVITLALSTGIVDNPVRTTTLSVNF